MKTKLLFTAIAFSIVSLTLGQSPFQKSVGSSTFYYHDLNLSTINDGLNEFALAGNVIDANFTNQLMALHRLDNLGNVVYANTYLSTLASEVRVLDIVNVVDKLYATGYILVTASGMRSVFIAEIQASNGAVLSANFYDIISPNFNSQGFKIVYTTSDADGDSVADPGFVVSGYLSSCMPLNVSCGLNIGFVMRTDILLNSMWTMELENNNTTAGTFDYDFINDITETPTGFFLTGSITGQTTQGQDKQGVLAYKIDFQGLPLWDMSYIAGNSRDLSVDAYYDSATQNIFMLANYSAAHYFGVTVLSDVSGAVIGTPWIATGNDLNRYGFQILESINDLNNLVITGYDRDENWTDAGSNAQSGMSNLFVHEFNKSTGAPVGAMKQYLVPHLEHSPDEFNFWTSQLPEIYYPDISMQYFQVPGAAPSYLHTGYRTDLSGDTHAELIATGVSLDNECINLDAPLTLSNPALTNIIATTGLVGTMDNILPLAATALPTVERDCMDTLLTINIPQGQQIKMYPNPTSESVFFIGVQGQSYRIKNIAGSEVLKGSFSAENSILLNNLTAGLYFIEFTGIDSVISVFKVIKE
tara:strand:+ start:340 stop:2097 length:1758 start_codon:yes stop_codon:yes gene_type:complete